MKTLLIVLLLYYCILSSNPCTNKHTKVFALNHIPEEYVPSNKIR